MLELVVGPFPLLERRLAEMLACAQKGARVPEGGPSAVAGATVPEGGPSGSGPLPEIAVVTPSGTLVRHLSEALVRDHGLALANVRFHSFQSLARSILQSVGYSQSSFAEGNAVDRRLLEKALEAGGGPLAGLAGTPGLLGTLGRTVLELEEAKLVTSGLGREALEKAGEDSAQLAALVPLMEAVAAGRAAAGLLNRADMVAAATVAVEAAGAAVTGGGGAGAVSTGAVITGAVRTAAGCPRVFHYGAYDLTQNQLDFLFALARTVPVTVLFPALPAAKGRLHPAYGFANVTLSLIGQKAERTEWLADAGASVPERGRFGGAGASGAGLAGVPEGGPSDGMGAMGKAWAGILNPEQGPASAVLPGLEVLAAKDEEAEWAMVAGECWRLIEDEGYTPHEIAVVARSPSGSLQRAASAFRDARLPWVSSWEIPVSATDPGRSVIALLRVLSGDFGPAPVVEVLTSRWMSVSGRRLPAGLVRALSASMWHGAAPADWELLEGGRQGDELAATAGSPAKPATAGPPASLAARAIAAGVRELAGAAGTIPVRGGWNEFVDAVLDAMERFVAGEAARSSPLPAAVLEAVEEALSRLRVLSRAEPEVDAPSFWRTALAACEDAGTSVGSSAEDEGIRLCDAMEGRGVIARAVFLVGLNESVFPRVLLEDPFLRDPGRRFLNDTLGLKIQMKGPAGLEEERLLFHLWLGAARERLYLSYRRADEGGRRILPSGFLEDVARTVAPVGSLEGLERVPRHASPGTFPASEAAARRLSRARAFQGVLEDAGGRAGPLDGILSRGTVRGAKVPALSVTEMVSMAKCPFVAFMRGVLEVRTPITPRSPWEPTAADVGKSVHGALEEAVKEIKDRWDTITGEQAAAAAATHLVGELGKYTPVMARFAALEEVAREELAHNLGDALREDLERTRESGVRPVATEKNERKGVRFGHATLEMSARIDRLDRGGGRSRLVDYKSHQRRERMPGKAAFDEYFLQLSLYAEILGLPDDGLLMAVIHMGQSIGGVTFAEASEEESLALRRRFRELAGELVRMAAAGAWFPSPYEASAKPGKWKPACRSCGFAVLCRKDHEPTLARLTASGEWKRYEEAFEDGKGGGTDG